jgi:hypothetical protein
VDELADAIVVDLPLRGEDWVAITSPADRIPSHRTDLLAQRYAYDFLRADRRSGIRFHRAGRLRTLLIGVPTRECHAWGAPIHAPFAGEIVTAVDGWPERGRVIPVREALLAMRNAWTFTPERLPAVLGNHVIVRSGRLFAAFAHLAPGSVSVLEGQSVQVGDVIGRVGHSGNSTSPHLHFQLMDAVDPTVARPVPCAFRTYDVRREGAWETVENGIPRRADRLRIVETGLPAA